MEKKYRELAKEMILAGVNAADPRQSIQDSVRVDGDILTVRGDAFSLKEYDRILLFGVGKAATPMCQAFEGILKPDAGLAITKIGEEICIADVKTIPVKRAFHPEPRKENAEYSRMVLDMVDAIGEGERALVFLMVSGGGSALFSCAPKTVILGPGPRSLAPAAGPCPSRISPAPGGPIREWSRHRAGIRTARRSARRCWRNGHGQCPASGRE